MRALANTVGSPVLIEELGGDTDTSILIYPMRLIDLGIVEREILRKNKDEFSYPSVSPETDLKIKTEVARRAYVKLDKLLRECKSTYLYLSLWLSVNNRGGQALTLSTSRELAGTYRDKLVPAFSEANGLDFLGTLESQVGPMPIQYTSFLSENQNGDSNSWPDWRSVLHQLVYSSFSGAVTSLPTEIAEMTLSQVAFSIRMATTKLPKGTDRNRFREWQVKRGLKSQTQKETSDSVLKELSMRLDDSPSSTS